MLNNEIINLHQEMDDDAARELSERVMRQRMLDREADQLAAIALNKESLNEINESEKLRLEAKKRQVMSYLIECSLKNANIVGYQRDDSSQDSFKH